MRETYSLTVLHMFNIWPLDPGAKVGLRCLDPDQTFWILCRRQIHLIDTKPKLRHTYNIYKCAWGSSRFLYYVSWRLCKSVWWFHNGFFVVTVWHVTAAIQYLNHNKAIFTIQAFSSVTHILSRFQRHQNNTYYTRAINVVKLFINLFEFDWQRSKSLIYICTSFCFEHE